jgi:hypothetical protein
MDDELESEIHFDLIDFKGNQIICTEIQWQDHVIGHKRHIELNDQEELAIAALTNPFTGIRYHDAYYPTRMNYYGEGAITKYIKVTVEFKDSYCLGTGYLKTAYPVNNMKPGEKPEWPQK